jgi:signal peptidase II
MKKNRLFWSIALIGLIFDQLTKLWIVQNLREVGNTIPLIPDIFHLTYVINTGAAFSFFSGGVFWLRWLSLAVSLGLMAYGLFGSRMKPIEQLGYGFILAGALGNGWDRFLFGYVVDFLDFRVINFPVFNLGVFWLIVAMLPLKSGSKRHD